MRVVLVLVLRLHPGQARQGCTQWQDSYRQMASPRGKESLLLMWSEVAFKDSAVRRALTSDGANAATNRGVVLFNETHALQRLGKSRGMDFFALCAVTDA